MIWKGKKVNINNYREIFKGWSNSSLEVIRSAILDDTPLEPYISAYKGEPHLLWEIKMALDEGIDLSWISSSFLNSSHNSFNILKDLRELKELGYNIKPIKKYLGMNLSMDHIVYILKWYKKGYSLDRYDFSILPKSLLDVFDYGLSLGYPMYLFNNGKQYSPEYVKACLKILSNNQQVSRFLDGDWYLDVLEMLATYSKSKYYKKLIDYVTRDITTSILEELYLCCKSGMDLKEISKLDEDGLYVYQPIKMRIIREAFVNKYDYTRLMNTELSVSNMNTMLKEMELNSMKRVSGRL